MIVFGIDFEDFFLAIAQKTHSSLPENTSEGAVRSVLVVDDSRAQRRILSSYLGRWGYVVFEAGSGREALELCRSEVIDLVVSDWMMPEMSGLEFCQEFRRLDREHYGYFILLTSKSDKAEVAQGLDVGADDFVTKPVAGDELLARIRAGERILRMERELTEKNRLVSSTLAELSTLYDALDRDLIEARKLQQSLVRERFRDFSTAQVSLLLRPCGHVGGDLVGFFPINDRQFGIFSIDVSGHGVASALMTARLAAYLTGSDPEQNLAICLGGDGEFMARRPSCVAADLNRLMLEEMDTDFYFTMVLGHFDRLTGEFVMTQCGHPNPVRQKQDGSARYFGESGLPIGLLPDATFNDVQITLAPGDRIFVFSDGVTECPDGGDGMLGDESLLDMCRKSAKETGTTFFDTFLWDLSAFNNDKDFPDDISAVLLEFPDHKRN
ncbi:sigma-B regulation protein RsbU (phosphoserine phosphatase) [Celeribacter halophilus]|uniref:Serine phosphatase RsbU, regulator of sigma subunit n=1 Tax=Celeribacter halophilus TaxID=576117 RepID=A0A1I3W8A7_9RHOB|nr:sigma-B regulation protein RsbU (phosphoserine phosphatase) [Celeribacter halophilus]SFK03682.1 Serine phosphatase RsbU, regulator of sigma subunit [Celeribacter halophilus]